jgi:hypothetical protein
MSRAPLLIPLLSSIALAIVLVGCNPTPDDKRLVTEAPPKGAATEAPPKGHIGIPPPYHATTADRAWRVDRGTDGRLSLTRLAEKPPNTIHVAEKVGEVAISPDGRKLVYTQGELGDQNLFVLDLTTPDPSPSPQLLIDWAGPEDFPTFTPDGRQVVFFAPSTENQFPIYMLDLTLPGRSPQPITTLLVRTADHWQPASRLVLPSFTADLRFEEGRLQWVTSDGTEYAAVLP